MEETAEAFLKAEADYGSESVWPYYYAGTMGLVMRDGIERLRHAKNYSGMYDTFCIALSWTGYLAGAGSISGVDPREMQKSDLIVIWGGNPVNTQVNVMTHAMKARKDRGAKIACVDIYDTGTMKQADVKTAHPPRHRWRAGLRHHACAVPRWLCRLALSRDTTPIARANLKRISKPKPRNGPSKICDIPVAEIEAFAKLIGETKRTYLPPRLWLRPLAQWRRQHACRLLRSRVTGAWKYEGGGALHSNSGMYKWNKKMIEGPMPRSVGLRVIDQSRIGPALLDDPLRSRRRPAGQGHARSEHQSGFRRARPDQGEAGPGARGSLRLRA